MACTLRSGEASGDEIAARDEERMRSEEEEQQAAWRFRCMGLPPMFEQSSRVCMERGREVVKGIGSEW